MEKKFKTYIFLLEMESSNTLQVFITDNIRSPIRFPDEEKADNKNLPKVFSFEAKDCIGLYDNGRLTTTAPTFTIELNGIVSSGIYEYSFPLSKMMEGKSEVVKPIISKATEQTQASLVKKEVSQSDSKSGADKPKKKKPQFEYGD